MNKRWTSCWLSFSSLSSGDPIHLQTFFKTSKSQCGLKITGGSSSRKVLEFSQSKVMGFIHSWSSSSSSPERSQVGSIYPRGEMCSPKGSSDNQESPHVRHVKGGVETSSKKQKSQAIDIVFCFLYCEAL